MLRNEVQTNIIDYVSERGNVVTGQPVRTVLVKGEDDLPLIASFGPGTRAYCADESKAWALGADGIWEEVDMSVVVPVNPDVVASAVSDWMDENIHEDPTVVIDDSLSVSGAAADAKATGDKITEIFETIIDGGIIRVPVTKNVDFSNSSNGYINYSGSLVGESQSTYVHSQPFALKSGEKIDITVQGYNNAGVILTVLAKVVTNGYQSLVNSIEGTTMAEDYTYTTTEDCTVIISYRADTTHTAVITGTENIDVSQQLMKKSHFVKKDGDSVYIKSHYNDDEDIVVEIALDGGNDLPNPKSIFTVSKSSVIMDDVITPSRYLLNRYTDWFSPHQVRAVDNIDGTAPTIAIFTGGNHQSNNSSSGGVATAENTQFDVMCDGVLLSDGDAVFGDTVEINITNDICGYNTWKTDGTGRKILKEQIRISMGESARMDVEIIHTAKEDVERLRYYGLQSVLDYYTTGIQYLGGANRSLNAITETTDCDNMTCRDGRALTSSGDILLIHIDTVDLGSFAYSPSTDYSYFVTGTAKKTYFSLINNDGTPQNVFKQDNGEQTCVRGWYDWVFSEPVTNG